MIVPKEVTIYDIASKLNISGSTVSRALKNDPVVNLKTRKKIVELAKEMGYRTNNLARNLSIQKTNTIGVIVPKLNSYFMATVISGIESIANNEGYNLIISQSSESFEKEIMNANTMFKNRVDGLLVSLAYNTENTDHFTSFLQKNIPVIFFDRMSDRNRYTNILIDNKKAAYEATKLLISEGCRDIIHITADSKINVYAERINGYKEALEDHHLAFNSSNVILNNLSQEAGVEAAEILLGRGRLPDGVFAANDNCAVGCMLTLKKAGIRLPEDIAFVGFNNDPVSAVVEPNLSTVNYPGYTMGQTAAQSMIDHLKGNPTVPATETIYLRSELVVRASSSRKPGTEKNNQGLGVTI